MAAAADAWSCVAGLSAGQDISERTRQQTGPVPQFGLTKSFPGSARSAPYRSRPMSSTISTTSN
ncbi:hypothetical protein ACFWY9_03830 [Amycolatopsis sp. NPDC059027]|uniref:hypothetical protein n=1 Tax=Amycolatopsis sp. NPDC059027 TaxID=3346709 RepID=UPI00366A6A73